MVDNKEEQINICKQCELLGVSRNRFYYSPTENTQDVEIMKLIDEIYTENPTRGSRRIRHVLKDRYDTSVGRTKIRKLMLKMGIAAIYPKRNLSKASHEHKKYPYLLRNMHITHVNQVWSTDITYIRLQGGFVYLTAIIDWYSRYVLAWKVSTSLDNEFCKEVLKEAIEKYGKPEIFNTDQGVQYTANDFTSILKENYIRISMDGKGRALDNIFVERLWRTVKYENVYLREYKTVKECKRGLNDFFEYYNNKREHQSLDYRTPADVYYDNRNLKQTA